MPQAAAEGARSLAELKAPLRAFVTRQPYGKHWRELVAVDPPPGDRSGLGRADSPPELSADPAEMQEQVQYLQPTSIEARYGLISIRGVRVFRYGRLRAVQLVLDRIGKRTAQGAKVASDLAALGSAWSDPLGALGLKSGYRLTRNELPRTGAKVASKRASAAFPIRIELEPQKME